MIQVCHRHQSKWAADFAAGDGTPLGPRVARDAFAILEQQIKFS
jgi:hypothetical protein